MGERGKRMNRRHHHHRQRQWRRRRRRRITKRAQGEFNPPTNDDDDDDGVQAIFTFGSKSDSWCLLVDLQLVTDADFFNGRRLGGPLWVVILRWWLPLLLLPVYPAAASISPTVFCRKGSKGPLVWPKPYHRANGRRRSLLLSSSSRPLNSSTRQLVKSYKTRKMSFDNTSQGSWIIHSHCLLFARLLVWSGLV